MEYEIFFKDELVMEVSIDENHFNVVRHTDNEFRLPFYLETREVFNAFLKSRCYDDNRADLEDILANAGMTSNNPYEWIKASHGVKYDDFFWIREKGECVTYKDVKVR